MEKVNRILLTVAIFASVLSFGYCQVPAPGRCPTDVKTVTSFDVEKYLGVWYEHSKYPAIFEIGGKCMQAEYGKFENGSVSVTNSQINILTGSTSSIKGSADLTEEIGKLSVKFPSVGSVGMKSNYWVLGTDYSSYAVVYSCSEHIKSTLHATIVWILTRERNPSEEIISKAYNVLDENKVSKTFLMKTDQEHC